MMEEKGRWGVYMVAAVASIPELSTTVHRRARYAFFTPHASHRYTRRPDDQGPVVVVRLPPPLVPLRPARSMGCG